MSEKHDRNFWLFETAVDVTERTAKEADSIGYMSRLLIHGCWPHKEQEGAAYVRHDGDYRITLLNSQGLPYGSYPRLIMAWVVTEAVLTSSPKLHLGRSLREFMRKLDIDCTGGKKGTIVRLKEQVERVFRTKFEVDFVGIDKEKGVGYAEGRDYRISESFKLWWSIKHNTADSLWESEVELSPEFFKEITERAYPLDMRVIRSLRKSPLALDLYFFLSYRMFGVNRKGKSTLVPWTALQKQLGAGYPETTRGKLNFKRELLTQITRIILLWNGLKVEKHDKGLILYPSKLAVSTKK